MSTRKNSHKNSRKTKSKSKRGKRGTFKKRHLLKRRSIGHQTSRLALQKELQKAVQKASQKYNPTASSASAIQAATTAATTTAATTTTTTATTTTDPLNRSWERTGATIRRRTRKLPIDLRPFQKEKSSKKTRSLGAIVRDDMVREMQKK